MWKATQLGGLDIRAEVLSCRFVQTAFLMHKAINTAWRKLTCLVWVGSWIR